MVIYRYILIHVLRHVYNIKGNVNTCRCVLKIAHTCTVHAHAHAHACLFIVSLTYLIRPGAVHDEFIDDEQRAVDAIIST